jgi:carbonic anhydrase/acetyltransferase-like protein (isoleucine patch superfamily)
MVEPSALSPRTRSLAAGLIQRVWAWVSEVGGVSPDDVRGRRFGGLGPGSYLAFPPGPVFNERWIRIGRDTLVGPHCSLAVGMGPAEKFEPAEGVEAVIVLGDRCVIGRGTSIVARHRIEIGDDVWTGPNVYITDHNHTYADITVPVGLQWFAEQPVRIGAGTWIGAGAVVLPGADIGRNVTIAAGTVVRGKVPDFSVVAGPPARVVREHVDGEGWVPPLRRKVRAPRGWPGAIPPCAGEDEPEPAAAADLPR